MKFLKAAAISAAMCFAGSASAWTLIYGHDGNGTATAGSLQALRAAVNAGASVKILSIPGVLHTWQVLCNQVSVRNDQTVVCVSAPVDLVQDITPGANFGNPVTPLQNANFSINTMGQYSETRIQKSNSVVVYRQVFNYAAQWFVE